MELALSLSQLSAFESPKQVTTTVTVLTTLQEARENEWDIGELIAIINQYKPSPIGVH